MNLRELAYRFKYRYAKYLPLETPVDVSLELASQCNMKCSYCYHADQDNLPFDKGFMELKTAAKIIWQASELGVNSLKFNWRGESSLNPNFYEITRYAKSLAKGSTFIDRLSNSNFKFANNRDDIFAGLSNQTKVKVSFDSFNPVVFEKQRAGGRHSITLNNIDKFYNHWTRIKSETEIVIQAVRTKLNKDEDIEGTVKKNWPEATVSIRDMVEGRVERDLDEYTDKERDSSNRQSCIQAHARLIFDYTGVASPCCPSYGGDLEVGDINKETMYQIFNGWHVKMLRKSLISKEAFTQDPCKKCSSHESYSGYEAPWTS